MLYDELQRKLPPCTICYLQSLSLFPLLSVQFYKIIGSFCFQKNNFTFLKPWIEIWETYVQIVLAREIRCLNNKHWYKWSKNYFIATFLFVLKFNGTETNKKSQNTMKMRKKMCAILFRVRELIDRLNNVYEHNI